MIRVFAFVFARGGSKGLPGKNIKPLAGKPLLGWSIDVARNVESIEKVFVSTDDPEIARVAREFEADVIDRPSELAADDAPEWLSWQHAIEWVQERQGVFDVFVSLPATAPLRSVSDVECAITALDKDTDIVLTMSESARSPWFNMVVSDNDGHLKTVLKPEGSIARRQDAPRTYDLTTVAYVARPQFILSSTMIWDGRVRGIEVSKKSAVDIDTIEDFEYAEFLLRDAEKSGAKTWT